MGEVALLQMLQMLQLLQMLWCNIVASVPFLEGRSWPLAISPVPLLSLKY